jgi:hypothetical protein
MVSISRKHRRIGSEVGGNFVFRRFSELSRVLRSSASSRLKVHWWYVKDWFSGVAEVATLREPQHFPLNSCESGDSDLDNQPEILVMTEH